VDPKKFVNSRVMSWVAFDRALRTTHNRGWPAQTDTWAKIRAQVYKQVMTEGWNEQKHSFVQYYGSDAVDASALLMMITNFTGSREPRMLSTIALGNFPQAFTHLALITACAALDKALNSHRGRPWETPGTLYD
jgi:GH15 family glucan-1,4-alpha-glucosidase